MAAAQDRVLIVIYMTAEIHRPGQQPEIRAVADDVALGAVVADVTDQYIAHALHDAIEPRTTWEIYRTVHVAHEPGEPCDGYCSSALWVPLPPVSEVRAEVEEVADYFAEHGVSAGLCETPQHYPLDDPEMDY
jgi:hypothetical protein